MSSIEDPAKMIRALSRPSAVLDTHQAWETGILSEAVKEVMKRSVRDLVEAARGLPVATSKSCDGTPMRVAHRVSKKLPSGRSVETRGRAGHEFLVGNQFVRANIPGEGWRTRVVLGEAVALQHGKSARAILGASFRDWFTLRQLGHAGCCVEHYVWDRASITALERLTRQYHLEQAHSLLPPSVSPLIGRLTEFVVITPCALHDGQNSFRWSCLEECKDTALMRDAYVAVESLRNSHDLITTHMAA